MVLGTLGCKKKKKKKKNDNNNNDNDNRAIASLPCNFFTLLHAGIRFQKVNLTDVSVDVPATVSFTAFVAFSESWHVYFGPFVAAVSYL